MDRDVRTFELSQSGQAITGQQSVEIVGRAAYENAFSVSSLQNGAPTAVNTPIIQPEELTTFELGYRTKIDKFSIDLSGYYNCLLYTSPSPRDLSTSRMPSSA